MFADAALEERGIGACISSCSALGFITGLLMVQVVLVDAKLPAGTNLVSLGASNGAAVLGRRAVTFFSHPSQMPVGAATADEAECPTDL